MPHHVIRTPNIEHLADLLPLAHAYLLDRLQQRSILLLCPLALGYSWVQIFLIPVTALLVVAALHIGGYVDPNVPADGDRLFYSLVLVRRPRAPPEGRVEGAQVAVLALGGGRVFGDPSCDFNVTVSNMVMRGLQDHPPRAQLSVPYILTASKSRLSASGVHECVLRGIAWRMQSTGVRPVYFMRSAFINRLTQQEFVPRAFQRFQTSRPPLRARRRPVL